MLSEMVMVESEPYSNIGQRHCLYIWIRVAGIWPHFLLLTAINGSTYCCSVLRCPQSVFGKLVLSRK